MNIKQIAEAKNVLESGHRMCAGCAAPIIVKLVTSVLKPNEKVVISNATGCLEVATTIYPYTSWKVPWIHNAFENAAATISGVETAYRALKKKGKIKEDFKFISFGGDGGTYDIGLQSLSGALERGHKFLYVCYDNEAYMNTGIQRSSATPFGAHTNTAQAGLVQQGKKVFRKDLTRIMVAHNIPYVAQASIHNVVDLTNKARKALDADGPSFLNVLSACVPGWKVKMDSAVELSKLAVETNFWPLYEVIDGKYKLNYEPKERKPITEFLKSQGRFRHLFTPKNKGIITKLQEHVDNEFKKLKELCR